MVKFINDHCIGTGQLQTLVDDARIFAVLLMVKYLLLRRVQQKPTRIVEKVCNDCASAGTLFPFFGQD